MKTIYLVRHGESVVNVSKRFDEGSEFPLTELGRKQAEILAHRAARLPIDALIASTMQRAQETAAIISAKIGKPVENSDLLVERKFPSSLIGRMKSEPEAQRLMHDFNESLESGGVRVDDADTFEDLRERTSKALALFQSHTADNILAVTHGYFLRVLIARVLFGEQFTARDFKPFAWGLRTKNTGLTVIRYNSDDERGRPWHVITWNDHAHLG